MFYMSPACFSFSGLNRDAHGEFFVGSFHPKARTGAFSSCVDVLERCGEDPSYIVAWNGLGHVFASTPTPDSALAGLRGMVMLSSKDLQDEVCVSIHVILIATSIYLISVFVFV